MTRLTSLVAVDQTPSRPDGARLTRAELPLNLPAGWDFDKVFGGERAARIGAGRAPRRRQTGAPAQRDAYAGVTVSPSPKPAAAEGHRCRAARAACSLPKTATDAELRMWFGLLLCVASLILIVRLAPPAQPCGMLAAVMLVLRSGGARPPDPSQNAHAAPPTAACAPPRVASEQRCCRIKPA